ncbi:transcriptional regulator PpsR [Jannaschia ovalis]|uniref:Transcriptional regulator PpsR n=1 Tax=Jannaschia ovalis TaxID=3038773 RepID=A0ABY8LG37_9RHOB|nr:transcriptional regulator PpsR [Jannaschia sp. GRR-S6-38]WGH80260.1 transcriptional regulator PpsR [Jannaschia sp. GRR-S6-38]
MNTRESDFWNERAGPRIAPEYFGDIVATAADMALLVAPSGRIISVTTNPLNSGLGRIDHWEGRPIAEFLAPDSIAKVERQLTATLDGAANGSEAIEVNHADGALWDFPVRYTFHRTGREGRVLMLGRDMRPLAELQQRLVRAQLALEKDYVSERIYETRYRVILDSVRDPLALVDATTGRVLDLNAPAARLLGGNRDELTGSAFTQAFEGRRRAEFIETLTAAGSRDEPEGLHVALRQGERAVTLIPRLFRNAGERVILCRFEPHGEAEFATGTPHAARDAFFDTAAEGIVFTDAAGTVTEANDAFLTMTDLDTVGQLRGKPFADFLARGSIDLKVLLDPDGPSSFATRIVTAFGSQRAVEVTVATLPDDGRAFVLRDAARAGVGEDETPGPLNARGLEDATAQVGSVPLRDIIAAMTDVIEKQCIEAAVDLTNNNRVAAAEMLGLSRQSLYVKLRKYGLLQRDEL